MSSIDTLVREIAKRHEALSNPIRIHILSIVIALGEASWSEIRSRLESIYGKINPNTLAFHIKRLMDQGLILRSGLPESPTYMANTPKEIERELEEVIRFYKELVGERR